MVDTHAHIYHGDESTYPMIEDPFRPQSGVGTIAHLRENTREAGVEKVVLVQTGSAYRWDNRLLADTARENDDWTVGVCTLDPASTESVPELERLAAGYNVKGLRIEPTRSDYPQYYHPGSVALWEAAQRLGVVICAHVQSKFLRQLSDLLARFPEAPVVLDHAAYPKAAEGLDSETVNAVVDLARFSQLYIKMSFVVTGSGQTYPFEDMHGIVRRILGAFGANRCMWGSDFPCEHWLKKASYTQHLELFKSGLALSGADQAAVLSDTATALWFS